MICSGKIYKELQMKNSEKIEKTKMIKKAVLITNYKSRTERGLVRGPKRVTQTSSLFLRSVYFQFHSATSIPECDIRTVEGTSYLLV